MMGCSPCLRHAGGVVRTAVRARCPSDSRDTTNTKARRRHTVTNTKARRRHTVTNTKARRRHATLAACALLLATSALAQQTPALDEAANASWAPLARDELPSSSECWGFVNAVIAGGGDDDGETAAGPSAGGGEGGPFALLSSDELPFCTVDETDYDRCCEPVAFFSMENPAAGCLCQDLFLSQMGPVLFDLIAPMLGLDLDFYFWAEKCPQLGYPVPVSGNYLCPTPEEELQCTSQMTEFQLAEAAALLQLGAETAGSNESALPASWSKEANVCCWEGITCNADLRVANLLVTAKGLTGTLPVDFSIMSDLTTISLVETNLSGSLPPSWSVLTELHSLVIPDQRITGTLPPQYSTMISITDLFLKGNRLTGTLPEEYSLLGNYPIFLDLRGNQFSGTLPPCWSAMTATARVDLEENQLSGSLPPEWSTMSNMEIFRMAKNDRLRGTLPPQWSTFHDVFLMIMSDMQLSGTLPSQWSTMTALQALWLGEHSLTGTLPKEWSTLKNLHLMSIKSNLLTGSVPQEWSSLQLTTLYASGNWLVGSIPHCWDDNPDSVLGNGFLDFKVNYVSAAPESYQDADNLYNCMAAEDGQRMCPSARRLVLMVAALILSLVGVLILEAVVRGWGMLLTDVRFAILRLAKTQAVLFFTKSNMLLLAALNAMCQRLFILSPAFPTAERAFVAHTTNGLLGVAGSQIARLLAGTVCSMLPVVATLLIAFGFVGRALLVSLPRPERLPKTLAMQAWTLVASEDILRDNLHTLKIDQLLLLGMFLVCSLVVPLVVSFGLPEVIAIREVDPSMFFGVNSTTVQLIYLPRGMLALLAASYIIAIYSMVAALLIPGAVVWPSVAVNEAIRAKEATSQVQQSLRQLRRLRWAVPQALLSLGLCVTCMAVFSATEWHEEHGGSESDLSTVWGSSMEAGVISAVVGFQVLWAVGWNLAVWGSNRSLRLIPVAPAASADEEAASLSQPASDAVNGSEEASSCPVTCNNTAWSASTPAGASRQRSPRRWLPEVSIVGQTRARDNALLLVTVLQMLHVDGARAGPVVAWTTWLASVAILCWALLVRDAPKGFDDIHQCAAFGMVMVASDLAAILEADLAADSNDSASTLLQHPAPEITHPEEECCADYPSGCPRCQILLRRVPATLYRMQETLCISYRWQSQIRAVVRPPGHGPLASAPGLRNRVVGINMNRWQREQLLAAILRSHCTYVWLDVLSIPAALRPQEGSRLWELSEKLMSRMMAVYSTAACTLALLSNENEGERYCQRAWTLQEYCGSRELDVVCQSTTSNEAALAQKTRTSFKSLFAGLSIARQRGQATATAFMDEEVARYKELREYVRRSMSKAVPLWIRLLRGRDMAIDDLDERASLYAKVIDTVNCQEQVDLVRALAPVLLNTSVQTMDELRTLVRVSSRDCEENSDGSRVMKRAQSLLGIEDNVDVL